MRRWPRTWNELVPVLLLALACGHAQKRKVNTEDFECKDRRIEYIATGGLVYAEQGIRLTCQGNVPLVEKYFTDSQGKTNKESVPVDGSVWDKAWLDFEDGGWRNLGNCKNPAAGPRDPIYTFEATDGDYLKSFQCQGIELPFPYDRLRNALDAAAGSVPD